MAKLSKPKGSAVAIRVETTDPENSTAPVGSDGHTLIDPSPMKLVIRNPDRTVTTVNNPTRESLGHFLYRLTLAQEGTYRWRWEGTIPNGPGVFEGEIESYREVDFG